MNITRELKFIESKVFNTVLLATLWGMLLGAPAVLADEKDDDPIFGGQILSLTDPKEALPPSNDPRFKEGEGIVIDLQEGLIWKQQDSYQELKKWMNWEMAQDFIKEINGTRFAGYDDWRLPTREELQSLYDESKSIPWKYYWTVNEVHIDPIFGYTSCCFWSSEIRDETYAWTFNFIRGKAFPSPRGGPGLSLSAIRAVRKIQDRDNLDPVEKPAK